MSTVADRAVDAAQVGPATDPPDSGSSALAGPSRRDSSRSSLSRPRLSRRDPARPTAPRPGYGPVGPRRRDGRLRAYLSLTKPRIIELLLVTTVPAMLLADPAAPSLGLVLLVLVGGALAAGAANVINAYLDRDIDGVMRRTARRPLPAQLMAPRSALWFGLALATASVVVMAVFATWLATVLTVVAIVYYDLVYTRWLKRSTPQSTFWGGVCGALPVLIGWSAVTGSLAWPAWIMFGVVFFWQMPHFYALAIRFREDYARAGIPMLPVVATLRRVSRQSVTFAWLTVLTSLALWPLGMSWLYGVAAVAAGALFLVQAHAMDGRIRRGEPPRPMRLFHGSTTYLTIVFIAIAVDALFHA